MTFIISPAFYTPPPSPPPTTVQMDDLLLDLVRGMVRRVATRSGVIHNRIDDDHRNGDDDDADADAAAAAEAAAGADYDQEHPGGQQQQQDIMDEQDEGDALMRLETGSVRWLYLLTSAFEDDATTVATTATTTTTTAGTARKRKRTTTTKKASAKDAAAEKEETGPLTTTTDDATAKLCQIRDIFKGSRGFWTLFVTRITNHMGQLLGGQQQLRHKQQQQQLTAAAMTSDRPLGVDSFTFLIKSKILVPFILHDFPGRWDFAVRWLWEEQYQTSRESAIGSSAKGATGTHTTTTTNSYEFWLCYFLDQLFRTAEHGAQNVQLQSKTYIPWFVNQNESALFRKFLLSLPRLPTSFWVDTVLEPPFQGLPSLPATGYLHSLLTTPLNKPLPTPLQKLRFQLGLDLLNDLLVHRPSARRRALHRFLDLCVHTDRYRRSETIRIAKRLFKVDEVVSLSLDLTAGAATTATVTTTSTTSTLPFLQQQLIQKLEGFALDLLARLTQPPSVLEEVATTTGVTPSITALTTTATSATTTATATMMDTSSPGTPPVVALEWNEEAITRHLELYMVLASRNPILLARLLELFPSFPVHGPVYRTVIAMLGRTIAQIGMPVAAVKSDQGTTAGGVVTGTKKTEPLGMQLLRVFEKGCPRGSEILILRMLQVLNMAPKGGKQGIPSSATAAATTTAEESKDMPPRPSYELTRTVRNLLLQQPAQFNNPLFWAYILPGEGLNQEDVLRGVMTLLSVIDEGSASGGGASGGVVASTQQQQQSTEMETEEEPRVPKLSVLPDELSEADRKIRGQLVFATALSRYFYHHQQTPAEASVLRLRPADALILFHIADISPPLPDVPKVNARQMKMAIDLCLQHPQLATYYPYQVCAMALEKMLDRYLHRLPRIYMHTLRFMIRKFRELSGFAVDLLTKIANTRIFKGRGRLEGDGRAIWEYWVRCVEVGFSWG